MFTFVRIVLQVFSGCLVSVMLPDPLFNVVTLGVTRGFSEVSESIGYATEEVFHRHTWFILL
jgi:hypothetical protein